jgi:hypothetical protein
MYNATIIHKRQEFIPAIRQLRSEILASPVASTQELAPALVDSFGLLRENRSAYC